MKILVTAGNTQSPIDAVRCVTNTFTGRTGARIALEAQRRGHEARLLTSHPEVVAQLQATIDSESTQWSVANADHPVRIREYRTFEELASAMATEIQTGDFDVVIHVAAVSDFLVAGAYIPDSQTDFDNSTGVWSARAGRPCVVDVHCGKIKSSHPELWLRLVPAPKLVDLVRTEWRFRGVLVKFKLEVDIDETKLAAIAKRSRRQSNADLLVANTLEGKDNWALLVSSNDAVERIDRTVLPRRLLDAVELMHESRTTFQTR